jgi:predicted NBD/HSP70 family sugar kinase
VSRGRPRVMLRLNPEAARVVGVKLAPDLITIAVTDFCADVLGKLSLPIRIRRQTPAVIADLVEDGVRRCVSDADLEMKDIAGICVGLPGVVASASGVCRQSPIFSERDVAFGDLLTRRLGVAVLIDSDANLVALAEHWFGQGRELDDFLVISLEQSLGLGILHKGELFRGANGLSPDLGDLLVRGPAAVARLGDLATEDSVLAEVDILADGEGFYTRDRALEQVVRRAEAGEPKYARAMAAAGEALGFAIANLITLFAPPKVLICGRAIAASESLLGPLRRTVAALLPPSLADVAEIVVREWSDDIWVRGAAAMSLRELYGATWSTTGPAKSRNEVNGEAT